MEQSCMGFVPENTKKSMNWSVKVFKQWGVQRNANGVDCPKACELNYWLSRSVVDARREHGELY